LQYARHATSLLDEPVTEQSILGSVVPRNLAFLADPIIAHALLGKERSMYPALPSLAEAEQRGYKLDAVAITTEIRRVLARGSRTCTDIESRRMPGSRGHALLQPGTADKSP